MKEIDLTWNEPDKKAKDREQLRKSLPYVSPGATRTRKIGR